MGTDGRWDGVEVAVSQDAGDPDGFRVVFERTGTGTRGKLATVYVEGGEDPVVVRFVRAAGAGGPIPDRAAFERKAKSVVRALAESLAWD